MKIRIQIRSDPLIFGSPDPDPDPVLFSTDPDPTCNNGFIKSFLSWTKYKSESTNSSITWWVIISNFIPTYLKYIFFFISISGRIRNIFPAEPDPWKKMSDPHPWLYYRSPRWVVFWQHFSHAEYFCTNKITENRNLNYIYFSVSWSRILRAYSNPRSLTEVHTWEFWRLNRLL